MKIPQNKQLKKIRIIYPDEVDVINGKEDMTEIVTYNKI